MERISLRNKNIINFEDLIKNMPKFVSIFISECSIHNFIGIPLDAILSIHDSTIDSFEGLEFPIPHNSEERRIFLSNCNVRSFSGVPRSTIQAIFIAIFSQDNGTTHNPKYPHEIKLELPLKTIKLIHETVNPEIERRYSPKFNKYWPMPSQNPDSPQYLQWEIDSNDPNDYYYQDGPESWYIDNVQEYHRQYMIHADEWKMLDDEGLDLFNKSLKERNLTTPDSREDPYKDWDWNAFHAYFPDYSSPERLNWIYGYGLTERLFIPEKIDELHEIYKKTTLRLAQEYIKDSKKILSKQIERLVHEVDPELRKMLENNLPPSDPLILQIATKFAFDTQEGLKILK